MPSAEVPLMTPATIMAPPLPTLHRPTCSLSSHTWRESFSSLAGVGAGGRRFSADDFFLKASTRAADSDTRRANLRLLSASLIRAS